MQKSNDRALRQHDAVFLVAHGQDWVAEAIVKRGRCRWPGARGHPHYPDPPNRMPIVPGSNYAVQFNGFAYFVERIADGHRMTEPVATVELAERDLRRLYPTQVRA